jgi:hypothetical protein
MGYSVGRWEGDTLVVESIGFNDRSGSISVVIRTPKDYASSNGSNDATSAQPISA